MWHRKQRFLLKIGRRDCQLWIRQGRKLRWVTDQRLEVGSSPTHLPYGVLAASLQEMMTHLPRKADVSVLADSYWLPALLIETGQSPLTQSELAALANHRLTLARDDAIRTAHIMSGYQAGDTKALVFACPGQFKQLVIESISTTLGSDALSGLQPTLSFALRLKPPRGAPNKAARCILVKEQDRCLLVFFKENRIVGLHPAATFDPTPLRIDHDVAIHALRCGVTGQNWPVEIVSFEAPSLISAEHGWGSHVTQTSLGPARPQP